MGANCLLAEAAEARVTRRQRRVRPRRLPSRGSALLMRSGWAGERAGRFGEGGERTKGTMGASAFILHYNFRRGTGWAPTRLRLARMRRESLSASVLHGPVVLSC